MEQNYPEISEEMKERIRAACECNPLCEQLGLKMMECRLGYTVCEIPVRDFVINPYGMVHGGVLFTLADMTAGMAIATHNNTAPTIDSEIHFLSPVVNTEKITAVAREIKHGKTLMVVTSELYNDEGKEVAVGTFTYFNTGKSF